MEGVHDTSRLDGEVEERVWKKEVVMVSRPQGMPSEANFEVRQSELVFRRPPPPGLLVLKVLWLSVDPYLHEIMNQDNGLAAGIPPLEVGKPVITANISKVLASGDPNFKEGDIIQFLSPVADYMLLPSEHFSIKKIEHRVANVPLNQYLGVLGFPGLTVWVGLNVITQLQAKEEVFISAAAGAVGFLLPGHIASNCPQKKRPADSEDMEDRKGKRSMAGLVPDMVGDKPNSDASELCRAWGKVRDQTMLIFFDPSAKANFISRELASKLGIRPEEMGYTAEAGLACPGHTEAVTPIIGKLRLHIQSYLQSWESHLKRWGIQKRQVWHVLAI
ncbi:hypothetical protein L7F22_008075 [Adiantum nelumboides]|nr:hypothetical protein [Adiantum nelumboides]